MAKEGKTLVKCKSGYRMVPVNVQMSSPFTLQEPAWVPDAQCQKCVQCQGKFDLFNRRHHCRRCGKCFCDKCCSTQVALPRMLFVDPVRHCAGCSTISKKEADFFEKNVKTLTAGGMFTVTQSGNTDANNTVFTCKLSTDHRLLQIENESQRLDEVLMTNIEFVQILVDDSDSEGNQVASGLAMKYRDSCGEQQLVKLVVPDGQARKQGQSWVASMQKAFKMIHDARTTGR
ncbi:zinc finger FYVE domain-containing protein 21-like [Mya arenaria]|uniref:zinc finger FYVE domain-containing protein 21-like n=1 Tax=Mya arenaria TaxID=6604 RepID=UPI0022E84DA6|nr:zinc finger FYVE domain-containing protein 21-like [Mya arenaria]